MEKTLKGHTKKISALAFDKSGQYLVSCGHDLHIKLWSLQKFMCLKTMKGHDHLISQVRFTPSGDYIVSSSHDKTIRVWETSTGFCKATIEDQDSKIMCLALSDNGKLMISAGDSRVIYVWNTNWGKSCLKSIQEEEHENVVDCLEFAPHETAKTITRLVQSRKGNEQGETDKKTSENAEEEKKEEEPVKKVSTAKSKMEELKEKKKRLLQLKNKKVDDETSSEPQVEVQVKHDFFASGCRDKLIKIWNADRIESIMTLAGHDGWVNSLKFHHNGKYLFSGSDDKSVRIWDLSNNGVCVRTMKAIHDGFITSIAVSRKQIVTGSTDKTLKIYELR